MDIFIYEIRKRLHVFFEECVIKDVGFFSLNLFKQKQLTERK